MELSKKTKRSNEERNARIEVTKAITFIKPVLTFVTLAIKKIPTMGSKMSQDNRAKVILFYLAYNKTIHTEKTNEYYLHLAGVEPTTNEFEARYSIH